MITDRDALSITLARLGVKPEDAAEILRTMPSAALLEKSRDLLVRGLANRGGDAESPPLTQDGLFPIHLILVSLDDIRCCHQEFGIPDEISWETLSWLGRAIAVHRARHGKTGINLTRWNWLRFFGWLYQVGRLEVTPYLLRTHPKEAGPLFWYDDAEADKLGHGFKRGDPALGVHAPSGEPLTPEACDWSFRRMRNAFARVFPEGPPRIATGTSWLLDDQLAEYLPADSNILAFQRRFTLVAGARDDDESILGYVFGTERPRELESLPQRTALERAVVKHLRLGGHWRIRTGWMELPE